MKRSLVLSFTSLLFVACGEDEPAEFSLRFAAMAQGAEVGCGTRVEGLGTRGDAAVDVADLRFYISNIRALDEDGEELELTLEENEFQYSSAEGHVALIDLTGNTEGACNASAIAFAEGTSRVNDHVHGATLVDKVRTVRFDVGVPQAVMRSVIAANTEEGAPSPLREMYWSWASGYRHFVMNMAVETSQGRGEGYVHVGSRACGTAGQKALTDRAECGFVNTPTAMLEVEDLSDRVVELDVAALLAGVDFMAPVYDPESFDVIGDGPGVECHSAPSQPDCAAVFASLGVDMESGFASASANEVLSVR